MSQNWEFQALLAPLFPHLDVLFAIEWFFKYARLELILNHFTYVNTKEFSNFQKIRNYAACINTHTRSSGIFHLTWRYKKNNLLNSG